MIQTVLSLVLFLYLSSIGALPALGRQVNEVVLDYGLKALLLENHKSPAVTFQIWYRVGSRDEMDSKNGLSHYLEHMMFKGTMEMGPEQYLRIIAKNGGRSNTFTIPDATVYFATMSRDKIGIAIELEANRVANTRLDGTYFEPDKKVVLEERSLRTEDHPSSAFSEVISTVTHTVHPYRRPVIGWMENVQTLSPEDLKRHYDTYYIPNNAYLVVVDDFTRMEILVKIEHAFRKIQHGPNSPLC